MASIVVNGNIATITFTAQEVSVLTSGGLTLEQAISKFLTDKARSYRRATVRRSIAAIASASEVSVDIRNKAITLGNEAKVILGS